MLKHIHTSENVLAQHGSFMRYFDLGFQNLSNFNF